MLSLEFYLSTILAILLIVLDKMGKLTPPILALLLAIAFALAIHPAIANAWVESPLSLTLKILRGTFTLSAVIFLFSGIGIWLFSGSQVVPIPTPQSSRNEAKQNLPQQPTSSKTLPPGNVSKAGSKQVDASSNKSVVANPSGPVAIAPQGIANAAPNFGTQTVTNIGVQDRHLNPLQRQALKELQSMIPDDASEWLKVQAENTSDSTGLATEIHDIFAEGNKTGPLSTRLVESGPSPYGVYILVSGTDSEHFAVAEQIANTPNRSGVEGVHFEKARDGLGIREVLILVGFHPAQKPEN